MCEGNLDDAIRLASDTDDVNDGVRIRYRKQVDEMVSAIARLIGRQMAQEDHEALSAVHEDSSGIPRSLKDR